MILEAIGAVAILACGIAAEVTLIMVAVAVKDHGDDIASLRSKIAMLRSDFEAASQRRRK